MEDILDDLGKQKKQVVNFRFSTIIYWAIPLAIGLLFKLLHWPFSSLLILLGSAAITAYAWVAFIFLRGKDSLNNAFAILGIIWLGILFWGISYNGGYPYNSKGLTFYFIAILVVSGIYAFYWLFKKRKQVTRGNN